MSADTSDRAAQAKQLTTAMLKALAHPVRRQLLRELARRGGGRAADLAAVLDVPANSLSFHLRTLADAGLITEDPKQARDKRDRVWVRVESGPSNVGGPGSRPEDAELIGAVSTALIGDAHDVLDRIGAFARTPEVVTDGEPRATLTMSQRRLTSARFEELQGRLQQLFDEFADHGDEAEARYYDLIFAAADDTI